MKKIILIVLGVVATLAIGGFLYLKSYIGSFDQVKLQYDNEMISSLKRDLNFSRFNGEIAELSADKIKMMDDLILNNEFVAIQKAIIEGKISCVELVSYYLMRIEKYDGDLNSVIQLNPKALEIAKEMDGKLARGEKLGKLFGSVMLIKDNVSEMNMNTAAGAYALKDLETKRDSYIVQRLKAEDAIILGKNNLSEWSNFMSMPSSSGFSVLGGQTKNAYGKFDVGGSSSGGSVSASMGFATTTIGSETAGSLIFPAGQNSVVAIKPTMGVLSRDLIVPISEAQDTAGIIGKNVKDVDAFFRVAIGNDENDPMGKNADFFTKEMLQEPLNANFLKGKKVGLLKEESERANKLREELRGLGAEVVDVEIADKNKEIDIMSVLNYGIKNDVKAFLNNEDVISPFKSLSEIYAFNEEDPKKRMPFGAALHEQGIATKMSKEEYEKIVENNRRVASGLIDSVMESQGLDLIASFSNELSGIYAVATYPAVTVPSGYKESGEPYGVTFVGSKNDDLILLNAAYSYEQGTKHRVNP